MDNEHEFRKKILADEDADVSLNTEKKKKNSKKKKPTNTVIESKKSKNKQEKASQIEDILILNDERKKSIDDDLRHIYQSINGEIPDMSRFETKRRGNFLKVCTTLLISLVSLAGVAWFGFFTFQPQSRFSERDVIVSVHGPEELSIGDEVRYRIKYTNDQAVPLTQASIQVRYPAGFIFESSNIPASNDNNDVWQLGSINPQQSDVIEIVGRLYGDIDTEQSLRVFFNYTPANFSSEFQKVENIRTLFVNSNIDVVLNGPNQLGVGATGNWSIAISGAKEGTDMIVELDLSDGFVLSGTNPEISQRNPREWSFRTNATTTILTMTGMFSQNTPGAVGVRAYIRLDEHERPMAIDRALLSRLEQPVELSETDIIANLFINGVMGDFSLQAGDALNSTIVVRNSGDTVMENVSVRFVVDSPSDGTKTIYNWAALSDSARGSIVGDQRSTDTRRGSITWTSGQIPALSFIAPGAEVQIPFVLPILSSEQVDLTTFKTFISRAVGEIQYSQGGTRELASTNPIEITINSDLRFSTQHTIIENEANEEVHRIVYILENSFHGLENIRVVSDVYGDVTMGDIIVPAGTANFDSQTKVLTWQVDQMPVGIDILPLQFDLTVNKRNPSQTNLTSKIRVQARDVITGQQITLVGSEIILAKEIPEISA
jgi:hypothetical protein